MFRKLIVLFLLSLSLCNSALAWNKAGHYVTGAIAYDVLKAQDPKALDRAMKILAHHPAFPEWRDEIKDNPDIDAQKIALMLAAAFADDARRGQFKRFDRPDWHYVNFPVSPGQPLVEVKKRHR